MRVVYYSHGKQFFENLSDLEILRLDGLIMGSTQAIVPLDRGGQFPGRQPYSAVIRKQQQCRVKRRCGAQFISVDLINNPQDPVNLHLLGCRKGAKRAISGQENAACIGFSKSECQAVMNRPLRGTPHNPLRPEDAFTRKVHNFQAAANERLFLIVCEF